MTKTPAADHYRKEFAKRKESSDLIRWLLDEFEQTEKRLYDAEAEIARFVGIYKAEQRAKQDPSSPGYPLPD